MTISSSSEASPTAAAGGAAGDQAGGGAATPVPGWVEEQAGPGGGQATRHLQAAAHLSRPFRRAVIAELVEERHRVPAPAPGTDIGAVLAECLRARRHHLWTALACFVVLLVGLAFDAVGTAFALGALLQVLLWGFGSRAVTWAVVRLEPRLDTPWLRERVRRTVLAVFWALYAVELVFGVAILTKLAQSDTAGYDGYDGYGGYAVTPQPSVGGSLAVPVLLVVVWLLIGAVSRYLQLGRLAEIGDPRSAEPPYQPPAGLRPVFERLRSGALEAETVFGAFQPFVGSGVLYDDWTLHTELRPAEAGVTATPLTVAEAHETITSWLRGLSFGADYPGDALHALTVRDRVFRSGLRVERSEAWHGSLSPVGPDGRRGLAPDAVRVLDGAAHPRLRHYVEARAELWGGQVIVSTFVRVTLQGQQLYLEGLQYVLPPVAERYRAVDQALRPDGLDLLRCLWQASTHLGRDLADNTLEVWSALGSALRGRWKERWRDRMLAHDRKVDQSPRVSVRELGADSHYEVLFQHLDAKRVWSAVAERTQAALLFVLKQHGYSTEQFEAVVQNIHINNGVQNYNSTVSGAQAAGRGARASTHPTVPQARMGTN
ncbi:hypothetical protein DN069_01060 [Streptacidiphilus pinicola]|uniref:Uncharacterized protein n=1 Tax=Streptacidiphilus pinicola TaxID=2219663 RepID=A0A2X0JB03_9ACTN|nr:hypothetical protein [Streptacidiphilus pinicola]RAG87456.1 hypothetical protein DN069_01060 [Streptacidiphilus pinicola]